MSLVHRIFPERAFPFLAVPTHEFISGGPSERPVVEKQEQKNDVWLISLFNEKCAGRYFLAMMLSMVGILRDFRRSCQNSGTILVADALHQHNLWAVLKEIYQIEDEAMRKNSLAKFLTLACHSSEDLEPEITKLEAWRQHYQDFCKEKEPTVKSDEMAEQKQDSDRVEFDFDVVFKTLGVLNAKEEPTVAEKAELEKLTELKKLSVWLETQAVRLGDRWLERHFPTILLAMWLLDIDVAVESTKWDSWKVEKKLSYVNRCIDRHFTANTESKVFFRIVRWKDWINAETADADKQDHQIFLERGKQSNLLNAAKADIASGGCRIVQLTEDILPSEMAYIGSLSQSLIDYPYAEAMEFWLAQSRIPKMFNFTATSKEESVRIFYPGEQPNLMRELEVLLKRKGVQWVVCDFSHSDKRKRDLSQLLVAHTNFTSAEISALEAAKGYIKLQGILTRIYGALNPIPDIVRMRIDEWITTICRPINPSNVDVNQSVLDVRVINVKDAYKDLKRFFHEHKVSEVSTIIDAIIYLLSQTLNNLNVQNKKDFEKILKFKQEILLDAANLVTQPIADELDRYLNQQQDSQCDKIKNSIGRMIMFVTEQLRPVESFFKQLWVIRAKIAVLFIDGYLKKYSGWKYANTSAKGLSYIIAPFFEDALNLLDSDLSAESKEEETTNSEDYISFVRSIYLVVLKFFETQCERTILIHAPMIISIIKSDMITISRLLGFGDDLSYSAKKRNENEETVQSTIKLLDQLASGSSPQEIPKMLGSGSFGYGLFEPDRRASQMSSSSTSSAGSAATMSSSSPTNSSERYTPPPPSSPFSEALTTPVPPTTAFRLNP